MNLIFDHPLLSDITSTTSFCLRDPILLLLVDGPLLTFNDVAVTVFPPLESFKYALDTYPSFPLNLTFDQPLLSDITSTLSFSFNDPITPLLVDGPLLTFSDVAVTTFVFPGVGFGFSLPPPVFPPLESFKYALDTYPSLPLNLIFDQPLLSDITSTLSFCFNDPITPLLVDGPLLTFNDVAVTTFVFPGVGFGFSLPPPVFPPSESFKYVLDTYPSFPLNLTFDQPLLSDITSTLSFCFNDPITLLLVDGPLLTFSDVAVTTFVFPGVGFGFSLPPPVFPPSESFKYVLDTYPSFPLNLTFDQPLLSDITSTLSFCFNDPITLLLVDGPLLTFSDVAVTTFVFPGVGFGFSLPPPVFPPLESFKYALDTYPSFPLNLTFDQPLLSDITSTLSFSFNDPITPLLVDGPLLTFNDVAVTTFVFPGVGFGFSLPPPVFPPLESFKYALDTYPSFPLNLTFDQPLLSDITSTLSFCFNDPITPLLVDGPLLTFNDVAVTTFVFPIVLVSFVLLLEFAPVF